jgi:hypothetical protein
MIARIKLAGTVNNPSVACLVERSLAAPANTSKLIG